MPGGSKVCRTARTASTSAGDGAELFRRRGDIAGEITGLVDQIDQILRDHAPHRIGNGQRHLLAQPVGQRGLGGHESFGIVIAVVAAACAGAGPFRIAHRYVRTARADRLILVGRRVIEGPLAPLLAA